MTFCLTDRPRCENQILKNIWKSSETKTLKFRDLAHTNWRYIAIRLILVLMVLSKVKGSIHEEEAGQE